MCYSIKQLIIYQCIQSFNNFTINHIVILWYDFGYQYTRYQYLYLLVILVYNTSYIYIYSISNIRNKCIKWGNFFVSFIVKSESYMFPLNINWQWYAYYFPYCILLRQSKIKCFVFSSLLHVSHVLVLLAFHLRKDYYKGYCLIVYN